MKIISAEFVKGIMGTDSILDDGVPQIAFVGRSNVGKSSVINSLVGSHDLVKVGKKPGKTTEINIFVINKGKKDQFYFVDLPGYGYAKVGPEMKEKILKVIRWYLVDSGIKLSKVVLILDVKAGLTDFDEEMISVLEEQGHPYVIVANKVDKLNQKELREQINLIEQRSRGGEVVEYSAKTKIGVNALLQKVFL